MLLLVYKEAVAYPNNPLLALFHSCVPLWPHLVQGIQYNPASLLLWYDYFSWLHFEVQVYICWWNGLGVKVARSSQKKQLSQYLSVIECNFAGWICICYSLNSNIVVNIRLVTGNVPSSQLSVYPAVCVSSCY